MPFRTPLTTLVLLLAAMTAGARLHDTANRAAEQGRLVAKSNEAMDDLTSSPVVEDVPRSKKVEVGGDPGAAKEHAISTATSSAAPSSAAAVMSGSGADLFQKIKLTMSQKHDTIKIIVYHDLGLDPQSDDFLAVVALIASLPNPTKQLRFFAVGGTMEDRLFRAAALTFCLEQMNLVGFESTVYPDSSYPRDAFFVPNILMMYTNKFPAKYVDQVANPARALAVATEHASGLEKDEWTPNHALLIGHVSKVDALKIMTYLDSVLTPMSQVFFQGPGFNLMGVTVADLEKSLANSKANFENFPATACPDLTDAEWTKLFTVYPKFLQRLRQITIGSFLCTRRDMKRDAQMRDLTESVEVTTDSFARQFLFVKRAAADSITTDEEYAKKVLKFELGLLDTVSANGDKNAKPIADAIKAAVAAADTITSEKMNVAVHEAYINAKKKEALPDFEKMTAAAIAALPFYSAGAKEYDSFVARMLLGRIAFGKKFPTSNIDHANYLMAAFKSLTQSAATAAAASLPKPSATVSAGGVDSSTPSRGSESTLLSGDKKDSKSHDDSGSGSATVTAADEGEDSGDDDVDYAAAGGPKIPPAVGLTSTNDVEEIVEENS